MDDFKDSTKTHYSKGGMACSKGYAKGGSVKGAAKVAKVMREFKHGELHSGSKGGPKVKSRKQAIAIAMSEAGKKPMKKAKGGQVTEREMKLMMETARDNPKMTKAALGMKIDREKRRMREPVGALGAMSDGDMRALPNRSRGVPAFSAKPLIGRKM